MGENIRTLEELTAAAQRLVHDLLPKDKGATLITLTGELGAGKTAYVQAVAKALGVIEHVTSPTFVLEKIYALPEGKPFERLVHIDAYRLETGSELLPLGFDEILKERSNLIMLEWPEKVSDALPQADIALTLLLKPDGSRTLTYA